MGASATRVADITDGGMTPPQLMENGRGEMPRNGGGEGLGHHLSIREFGCILTEPSKLL